MLNNDSNNVNIVSRISCFKNQIKKQKFMPKGLVITGYFSISTRDYWVVIRVLNRVFKMLSFVKAFKYFDFQAHFQYEVLVQVFN